MKEARTQSSDLQGQNLTSAVSASLPNCAANAEQWPPDRRQFGSMAENMASPAAKSVTAGNSGIESINEYNI